MATKLKDEAFVSALNFQLQRRLTASPSRLEKNKRQAHLELLTSFRPVGIFRRHLPMRGPRVDLLVRG